jgi:hypothetical protein
LSSRVVKSLGKNFCKIQNKYVSDEELKKKPLTKKAAGHRVKQGKKNKLKDANEELPKKKNRKMQRCGLVLNPMPLHVLS